MTDIFGLSDAGFRKKRLDDIKSDLEATFRSVFGAGIKTGADTTFGKLIGIFADSEAAIWEQLEAVYNSQYPNSASGQSLANIGQYTGVSPNGATHSTVTLYFAGVTGVIVPVRSRVAVEDSGAQFETLAAGTIPGPSIAVTSITRSSSTATATAVAHGAATGDFVFNTGANQAEYNGLHQITVTDADHFTFQVTGTPATPATGIITAFRTVAVPAQSVDFGPVNGPAGTISVIVNPIPGWNTSANFTDAVAGRLAETDAAFRIRRLLALQGLGAARQEAIRGALLGLNGVTNVVVFVNDLDVNDSDGRPPHSIECMLIGGDNQQIIDTIWAKKAAGIQTTGTSSGTTLDSQGTSHTVKYSRPTQVLIYLDITIAKDVAIYPSNGNAQVLADILAYAATLTIGADVIVTPALVGSFAAVPGITGVTVKIGTAPSPTLGNNITITATQIAVFDSSRITVT